VTQLPEITLRCRYEHSFTTRARGGTTLACPVCRKAGNRVSVWVPRDRPKTEREARLQAELARPTGQADTPAAGSELADRWERETPWDGKLSPLDGRAGDECPECDDPLLWEPGRTVTYCHECERVRLPAAVAEHYQRQDQRSAEVAVRTGPGAVDRVAARRAQVRLDARKQRTADQVNELIEAFDPDGLYDGPKHLALDYRAGLNAYLRQISKADSEGELAEIEAEVKEIITQAETSGAVAAIERQREAIERQAEYAERQAELAEQAEREAREAEREARQRTAIEMQQRKAIESRTTRKPAMASSPNGYLEGMVMVAAMIENNRRNKERRLNEHGPCGYQHRKPTVPERRYWITTLDWQGNQSGYELPNAPAVVACSKHFAAADAWIQEQAALIARRITVHIQAVHTELK
jgi:hypothetical protein